MRLIRRATPHAAPSSTRAAAPSGRSLRRLGKSLLPQVPLALVIVAAGVFNIVDGAQLGVGGFAAVDAFSSLSSEL